MREKTMLKDKPKLLFSSRQIAAIILPFLWYMAVVTFTSAYAAYPIIDRYMIAPYANQSEEAEETEEAVEE